MTIAPAMERLRRLPGFRECGRNQFEARCPGHEDDRASLSIGIGNDGKVNVHCHAGCALQNILGPIGLTARDLYPDNGKPHHDRRTLAAYDYTDAAGKVVYQVVRLHPKDFIQRRPDGNGGWISHRGCMKGIGKLPYKLPELAGADYVFVVEGEKDVEALRKIGLTATCNSGGADKWSAELNKYFRPEHRITIIPDNDKPGRDHAKNVAANLHGKVASLKILELSGLPERGDVSDWLIGRDLEGAAEELSRLSDAAAEWEPREPAQEPSESKDLAQGVELEDLYAYMPTHSYIFAPTRQLWPASSVNSRVQATSESGKPMQASAWLDTNHPVEEMTWAPGFPMLVKDRLIDQGGWFERRGCTTFNLYRPPTIGAGDPGKATPWLDHLDRIFPDDREHIIKWLAHQVQKPHEKINHALVLGGAQGIGKDTLLEPLKYAVGPWNFSEITPAHLLMRFNGWIKSVILRINEARDLGDVNRYAFYEHIKLYTASPPEVVRCDEKNIREHAVFNLCGVIITTNHKTDGIYLPADDRRHYVAWSSKAKEDFEPDYWIKLHKWYEQGGRENVTAFLQSVDISDFDAKAPPPKTDTFWAIVDAGTAPEDAELSDAIDKLGNPDAFTLAEINFYVEPEFAEWLKDRANSRYIPHRMEAVGYVAVRYPGANDGRWKLNGRRQVIYAKQTLCVRDQIRAAMQLVKEAH